jgi:hypothetical protein
VLKVDFMIEFSILILFLLFLIGIFFYPPLGAYVVKFITSPKRITSALIRIAGYVCFILIIIFVLNELGIFPSYFQYVYEIIPL